MMKAARDHKQLQLWKDTLEDHDLRLTDARQTVMRILASSSTALTAQEIYDRAREAGHAVGIASVYRTLDMLAGLNLIQQIHQLQGCQAYGPVLTGHKHFLICTECGQMVPFAGREELEDLFQEVEENSGYRVREHWLQLFGLCGSCQPKPPSSGL